MASAKSVYNDLGSFQKVINACLARCDAAPFPSIERENRIKAIRQELADISLRAEAIYSDITKEAQTPLLAKSTELAEAQAALAKLHEEQRTLQVTFKFEKNELARRQTSTSDAQQEKDLQAQAQNC